MKIPLFQCLNFLSSILGAPPELVQKLLNDSKAMVCITMDGPFYCFSFKSSIMPMEMGFKVGEEFDFASPFDPTDVQKVNLWGTLSLLFIKLRPKMK